MLCQFLLYSKVTQSYIDVTSFSYIPTFHHARKLDIVPWAVWQDPIAQDLCYMAGHLHSKCNSLHPLTPNSQSISLLSPPPWQPQVCSLCP